ncbi:TadE family type IV pilus minor pilin [Litorihabitans aurantiacus]|uniref:TadE-like protein n=1 Tax=Litorihabitans aurantiacus TaxID=1930061 RepID=A0AA37XGS7_9MICO|nr:TadE family type IV pilus minor pilin [Litorihabitans aurantiacus]GMA32572.1 hypothetical protein GCM10025875_25640 [Litorihabitans aurantiacus]
MSGAARTEESVRGRERGSATAELAVALPAVVVVLLALLLAATAGSAAVACADAARVGARSAALGLDAGEVRADAQRVAGEGARVEVARDGAWVRVVVRRDVRLGSEALGGTITVSGRAQARLEPGE